MDMDPQKLGKYTITRRLGQGAMGVVYEGKDPLIDRTVAIKTIRKELLVGKEGEEILMRFQQEAQAAGRLTHPNIVGVYEYGEENDTVFIAMEFIKGRELEEFLQESHRFPMSEVVSIMSQLLGALHFSHLKGVVHRDIKPANLVMMEDGQLKVTDFGIARIESSKLTQMGTVMGTPSYMSPEQCQGLVVDHRSDLFSSGVILYQLLTGERPFTGSSITAIMHKVIHELPTPPSKLNVQIPPQFDFVIAKALAKSPDERYQTGPEFIEAIKLAAERKSVADATMINPALATQRDMTMQLPPGSAQTVMQGPGGTLMGQQPGVGTYMAGQQGTMYGQGMPGAAPPNQGRRTMLAAISGVVVLGIGAALFVTKPWETPPPAKPVEAAYTGRGVTTDKVIFGMSAAFSGPTKEMGRSMEIGLNTAFREVNDAGGLQGRKLELISMDDQRNPETAVANAKELLTKRNVLAMVGNVGTEPVIAAAQHLGSQKTLLFGPYTGAVELRKDPPERYVFNFRASYVEEASQLVYYLVKVRNIKPSEIAVFAQEDGYGESGYIGVVQSIRRKEISGSADDEIVKVTYPRGKSDVSEHIKEFLLKAKNAKAVVIVATARPTVQFVTQVRESRPDLIMTALSAAAAGGLTDLFKESAPAKAKDLVITQVVPHYEANSTGVLRFRESLKKYFPQEAPNFATLEGYIVGKTLAEGVRRAGNKVDNEALVNALESIKEFDLGIGTVIGFSPSKHQGSSKVWGTVLDEEAKFKSISLE